MKKTQAVWAGLAFVLAITFISHAQTTARAGQSIGAPQAFPADSIVQLTAEAQGLSLVPPDEVPLQGTFWLVLPGPDGGVTAPMPGPPLDSSLPIYAITTNNQFLVDGTGGQVMVDSSPFGAQATSAMINSALEEQATAVVNLITWIQFVTAHPASSSPSDSGMSPMFGLINGSGGNQVYLTNLVATPANGTMAVTFSIAGGTNGFAYDIYSTTNLASSPVYSQWTWLGQGYTTNSYTFANQPIDNAFYILAIPSQTMVVAWGDNNDGQCDVPSGLTNAIDVAGGYVFSLALKADGTVVAWGDNTYGECNVPAGLTNVTAIAAGGAHGLALLQNGTVTAWGANGYGQTNVPADLTNVTAIAAGYSCSFALRNDGSVVAWGQNTYGQTNVPAVGPIAQVAAGNVQGMALLTNGTVAMWANNYLGYANFWHLTNVPAGLSNVVSIAAGDYHALALQANGTVQAWGAGSGATNAVFDNVGQSIVPVGLSNVVAVAGGALYSMALRSDGTVVEWGDDTYGETDVPDRLTGVKAISAGGFHGLAIRSGSFTPLIWEEPEDQFAVAGATVTFSSEGEAVAGVSYQWQFNGVNIMGATNASLTLTNVQSANEGSYQVIISNSAGFVTSDAANLYVVTPPVITYQSQPTNITCIYGNYVAFAAMATAPYQANGFPLSYQWQLNGTNISSAIPTNYAFAVNDNSSGVYSLIVSNAAGSASASWQVTVTNTINVTNDLLLIYNSNSADSTTVLNYYLAHRPMVGGANVLGIGCPTNEIIGSADFTNQILTPYLSWLTNNPTKHPQYLVLFLDIPSRIEDMGTQYPSVQYQLATDVSGVRPYVTSINMSGTNDCIGYINKLGAFGTNGQLVISASARGYGNANFIIDNVRHGPGTGDIDYSGSGNLLSVAIPAITNANSSVAVNYLDGIETSNTLFLPHITNAVNVAGYICWGGHSNWGTNLNDANYSLDGNVLWSGNSTWWIIRTEESYNGQVVQNSPQGNFIKWFSNSAFGGTNYSNTPVGAVTYVEEPGAGGTDNSIYFGLWASGKNFGICAWNSRNTTYFQAVGDPFVTR